MLTIRELVIADDGHTGPIVTVTDDKQTTRYRTAATHFDATTFFPLLDRYEVWQLINLIGDTDPIHVHLDRSRSSRDAPSATRSPNTASKTAPSPPQSRSDATLTTSSTTPSTTTYAASRTPSASTPARSPKSPSASPPTAAATCTTAISSSTKTAT